MNEQNDTKKQEAAACGPGCNCGTTGVGARTKWVICGVVGLAAVATVAAHVSRTHAADTPKQEYATAIPAVAPVETAKSAAPDSSWGTPLKALADLNLVATNTEGVFVVLPSSDDVRTAAIQKEVAAAASTISTRGTKMGRFLLSRDSQEYTTLARQTGVPAVLAMVKGRGMAAVQDNQVTQESLLKAFVSASRPSGCGPSGCSPSSAGCK